MLYAILLFSILSLAAGAMLLTGKRGSIAFSKKRAIYLLGVLVLFGGLGVASAAMIEKAPHVLTFACLEALVFIAGIAHYRITLRVQGGADDHLTPAELWLTLLITGLSGLAFTLLFHWNERNDFAPFYSWVMILFAFPALVMHAFSLWRAIPHPIYKKWFYTSHKELPLIQLDDTMEVSFQCKRKPEDPSPVTVAVRVPLNHTLGDLFYYFIYRHNTEREPAQPIIVGLDGNPYPWIFYAKPAWIEPRRYLDPTLTVTENKLRRNATIVALQLPPEPSATHEDPVEMTLGPMPMETTQTPSS